MTPAVHVQKAREIFQEWQQTGCSVTASVFDGRDMRSCAGTITFVGDSIAIVTNIVSDLSIPFGSVGDCAVTTLNERAKSLTLTWRDGTSAFIVTRT